LSESKAMVEAFHQLWRKLPEKRREKEISNKACDKLRLALRRQVWMALERLKAKYDGKFNELEEHIKARFRALKPSKRIINSLYLSSQFRLVEDFRLFDLG